MVVGWGSVVAVAAGIFWFTAKGAPAPVRANRRKRRRSTRRRRSRRTSRRRVSRNARRRTTAADVRYVNTPRDWDRERNKPSNWNKRIYYGPRDHLTISMPRNWYVESPNGSQLFYSQAEAKRTAKSLARQYSLRTKQMKWTERSAVRRRLSRNPKIVGGVQAYAAANPGRRYKALSAASRKRMPPSSFALPGKRFPVKGPPGSSRERDKWQALQAIRYLRMGRVKRRADYLAIRSAIIRLYGANFWRSCGGPSWPKVEKAKRKRRGTRRGTKRRTSRRLAANRR